MALSETGKQQTRQNIHAIKINSTPLPVQAREAHGPLQQGAQRPATHSWTHPPSSARTQTISWLEAILLQSPGRRGRRPLTICGPRPGKPRGEEQPGDRRGQPHSGHSREGPGPRDRVVPASRPLSRPDSLDQAGGGPGSVLFSGLLGYVF